MFVGPANDDYWLRANSPALKLSFQPIDLRKIGPRAKPRAPKWVAGSVLPRRVQLFEQAQGLA